MVTVDCGCPRSRFWDLESDGAQLRSTKSRGQRPSQRLQTLDFETRASPQPARLPPGRTAPCCGIFDSELRVNRRGACALTRPGAAAALGPATSPPAHDRYARLRRVPE